MVILHGCAVGGGSITYANTLLVPRDSIWESGSLGGAGRLEGRDARRITRPPRACWASRRTASSGPADHILKQAADAAGVGSTFYRTRVAYSEPAGRRSRAERPIPTRISAAKGRSGPPASAAAAA